MSGEFGTGKTIFVLAIVVGCFAVLWPKIFYPMLTASVKEPTTGRQERWRDEANLQYLSQLCYLLGEHQSAGGGIVSTTANQRWTAEQCWSQVHHSCGLHLTEKILEGVRLSQDKTNLTECLAKSYSLTPALIAASATPKIRPKAYLPQGVNTHARPERPAHLYPEMMHPALREKGRALPTRTVDKQPRRTIEKHVRPGPMPGVRPPMGGAGGIVPPPQGKGSGAMGIIMPLYTVGIVVFFVYTIMKVLFKKGQEDDKTPKLKDFGLDPEYRKYVFAEEYLDNTDVSTRDQYRRQQREESRSRKKFQQEQQAETTKIGGKGWKSQNKMDTKGKKLGEWYLPEGFINQSDDESDDEALNLLIGGATVNDSARETYRDRLQKGLYYNTKKNCKPKTKSQFRSQQTLDDSDYSKDEDWFRNMERSQCGGRHGQTTKKQVLKDISPEETFTDEEVDYMLSDEFFQLLQNGLKNYDPGNNMDGEKIEEICQLARDHLFSRKDTGDLLSNHQYSSEEVQSHPDDVKYDTTAGLPCENEPSVDHELSEDPWATSPYSSQHNSSEKSEEDSAPIVSHSGSEEEFQVHDSTDKQVDMRASVEDHPREEQGACKEEPVNVLKEKGKPECDKISTAISGILAELDEFSHELEARQKEKKEELARMMEKEEEERKNKQNVSKECHSNKRKAMSDLSPDASPSPGQSNNVQQSSSSTSNGAIPLGFTDPFSRKAFNSSMSSPVTSTSHLNSYSNTVSPAPINENCTHSSTHTTISTRPSHRSSSSRHHPRYPFSTASNPASTNRHSRRRSKRTSSTCSSAFNSNKVPAPSSRAFGDPGVFMGGDWNVYTSKVKLINFLTSFN
ncbi:uncharacterized protein LOC121874898 isoform X14 [Homarus americanus]|uniref:uncharacterized protein LOC121874898 isoform X14 n=1 Tax=Homarus americanus TaxID=6706 RepID=UPI001C461095|nr:uncharacterized protein LOC121874898 isoform X14 [Homarus americanus]